MVTCPSCGNVTGDVNRFCASCGAGLQVAPGSQPVQKHGRVFGVLRSLLGSGLLAGLTLGASAGASQFDGDLGILVLVLGGFVQTAWPYRKRWPAGFLSCLMPALATSLGSLSHLSNLPALGGDFPFRVAVICGAATIGLLLGLWRGAAQPLIIENSTPFAKHRLGALLLWFLCFLGSHAAMVLGQADAVIFGFAGEAFTSAFLVMSSCLLYVRAARRRHAIWLQRREASARAAGSSGRTPGSLDAAGGFT